MEFDECPNCGEEVMYIVDGRGRRVSSALQTTEIQVISWDGKSLVQHQGHERHHKYCSANEGLADETGAISAEPPARPDDLGDLKDSLEDEA